jgi:enoyl-CoA hydratase/carnithine racemase
MELTQTKCEIEKGVATVTLYRPEQLNAFTHTMRRELVEIFEAADRDDSVRVVVVKGAGKTFCAGADLLPVVPPSIGGSRRDEKWASATIVTAVARWLLPFSDAESP